jgi:UDP-N-acetylmuramate dehydrogenase
MLETLAFIQKDVLLAPYTTLGVGGSAEYFAEVRTESDLRDAVLWAEKQGLTVTIFAGGSNVLVSDAGIQGLVLRPMFEDVVYEAEEDGVVRVRVGAGVLLDAFVAETVSRGLWGLENLSAIPGSVGATPVQNVGAYGVEVKDVITSVTVFDCEKKNSYELKNSECDFSYRDSIFKTEAGKKYVITHVTFALSKNAQPKIAYKDLTHFFSEKNNPSLSEIREAIISIRSKKFPDWQVVGTAGSFFKNPIIAQAHFAELVLKYPDIPGYLSDDGKVKVALGWVLDKVCGLKGYTEGEVGLYTEQALVLVCTKGTSAKEVIDFSEKIIAIVFEKTKIKIEREVTML